MGNDARIALGAFDLLAPLAKGGMGEVWRGVHRAEGIPVAVKVVRPELAQRPELRALFRREVRAAAALDHPNVVLLFDHGEIDERTAAQSGGRLTAGCPYLVMEWASGGTLRDCAPDRWIDIRDTLLVILDALCHAHARGVVHRDLKLTNVLVCTDEDLRPGPKLADFGIALLRGEPRAQGLVIGTRGYMPPEQAADQWRDEGSWTDLYALGVLAGKLALGSTPIDQMPDDPFGEWTRRLLEPDPTARLRRAADAAQMLRRIDARDVVSARRTKERSSRRSASPPKRLRAGAVGEPTKTVAYASTPGARPPLSHTTTAEGLGPHEVAGNVPNDWRAPPSPPLPARLRFSGGAGLGLFGLRPVPLVDRESERDTLWSALREVATSGRPHSIALVGAAGTGKSRLAQWLGERAHETGAATVLRAHHGPIPGAADGLGSMFERHLGCEGLSLPDAVLRIARLFDLRDEADAEAIAIGTFLVAPERLPSAVERSALGRRLLARLANERPLLVCIDDAQWAPEALAFVRELLASSSTTPVLFVVSVREEALAERPIERELLASLLTDVNAARIDIAPLAPEHRASLVRELLGLSLELAARVEERAAGNPLFAIQLVSDWTQRGALEPTPDGLRLRAGFEARLPDGLRAVWRQTVEDALAGRSAQAGEAMEIAAALGQDVDDEEWTAACREAGIANAPDALEAFLARGLARTQPIGGWSFLQGMLREALVERAASAGRAAAHHRACARAIAKSADERRGRHLLAAGEPREATAPLLAAAEKRLSGGESGRAEAMLTDLSTALDAAGVAEDDASRAAIAALHAEARRLQGRYDEADALLGRAERLAPSDATLARIHSVRGAVARERGNLEAMLREYRAAWECAKRAGEDALAAICLRWIGIAEMDCGESEQARRSLEAALASAERAGDELATARTRLSLGHAFRLLGQNDRAQLSLTQALEGMRRAGARGGVADCLNALGELARWNNEPARAAELYRKAAELHESLGSRSEATARLNLGLALLEDERDAEARPILSACLATLERQGRRGLAALAHVALLTCAASAGDFLAWDRHADSAEHLIEETGFTDVDLARAAEFAAARAGSRARSKRAWRIAAAQWAALGHTNEAARANARANG